MQGVVRRSPTRRRRGLPLGVLCATAAAIIITTTSSVQGFVHIGSSSSSIAAAGTLGRRHGASPLQQTAAAAAGAAIESSSSRSSSPSSTSPSKLPSSTIIIGSGPTGLATSIMLARRGYRQIEVFDRLERPAPPDSPLWGDPYRSYNLGLSGRGQIALTKLGAWETVRRCCAVVVGRKDWTEKGEQPERIYHERAYKTQVIQRDRLTSCLLEEVERKYADKVKVHYQVELSELLSIDERGEVSVRLADVAAEGGGSSRRQWTQTAQLLVAADGVKSPIRGTLEATRSSGSKKGGGSDVRTFRYRNDNEYVYKTLPIDLRPFYGKGFRPDLNYSARSKFGATLEALPTLEGPYVGVLLFKPSNKAITDIKDQEGARAFFQEAFPQFMPMVKDEDLALFPHKPISRLPAFSYAGPDIYRGSSVVLLGDAIHSVKPYFGLGAQSALEDVMVLNECLDQCGDDRLGAALSLFSQRRAPEAAALVQLQHGFDGDPTTARGVLTFLVPIIMDGIFNKIAPQIFAPNGIRLLQDHTQSFTAVKRRKRRDRALQVLTLGVVGGAVVKGVTFIIKKAIAGF